MYIHIYTCIYIYTCIAHLLRRLRPANGTIASRVFFSPHGAGNRLLRTCLVCFAGVAIFC